jgi:hypothetical protein
MVRAIFFTAFPFGVAREPIFELGEVPKVPGPAFQQFGD